MAECVSCGKEIPAGKFFCDDCYVKMKGRRGPSGEMPRPYGGTREKRSDDKDLSGGIKAPAQAAVTAGVVPVSKASESLTPNTGKKVVSMKPSLDRAAKEKAGKKRFAVTITFSERTYATLAKLKFSRKKESPETEEGELTTQPSRKSSRLRFRSKGLYGRPRLRAVEESPGNDLKRRKGFMGLIGRRDRLPDRGDIAAIAMAVFATLAIILLSLLPWASISLGQGEAQGMQVVKVSGTDLGAITYACIGLAVASLLYMVAACYFKGALSALDYGVVFIIAGIVFIPLFYGIIASNAGFVGAALEKLGRGGSPIPAQYERQTLWPAYMMVFAGVLLAFAGLVRLSDRKGGASPGEEEKRGDG